MSKYSIIQVTKRYDGLVDGVWLQHCIACTKEEALQRARATEKANSNRISVAVVANFPYGGGPNYNHYRGLIEII